MTEQFSRSLIGHFGLQFAIALERYSIAEYPVAAQAIARLFKEEHELFINCPESN